MRRAIPTTLMVCVALLLVGCAGARSGASIEATGSEAASSGPAAETHSQKPSAGAGENGDADDYTEGRDYSTDAPGEGGDDAGEDATVTLTGYQFDQSELTVAVGTEVTFVNEDTDVTFDEAGTYHVTCLIHPTMNMTITVEG